MPRSLYEGLLRRVEAKGETMGELDSAYVSLVKETTPFQIVFVNRFSLVGPTLFNFSTF